MQPNNLNRCVKQEKIFERWRHMRQRLCRAPFEKRTWGDSAFSLAKVLQSTAKIEVAILSPMLSTQKH